MPRVKYKKGQSGNPAGKPKGALNRTTLEAKMLLEKILFGQVEGIEEALEEIKAKDPARYLDACAKLFTYVLPKKTDLTSGDKPIKPALNITVASENTERLLNEVRGEDSDNQGIRQDS